MKWAFAMLAVVVFVYTALDMAFNVGRVKHALEDAQAKPPTVILLTDRTPPELEVCADTTRACIPLELVRAVIDVCGAPLLQGSSDEFERRFANADVANCLQRFK